MTKKSDMVPFTDRLDTALRFMILMNSIIWISYVLNRAYAIIGTLHITRDIARIIDDH